jgi:hypothetical protein
MRLTLRTLLAWLDDTLPPAEVRQIGHQVAESPFAQELVERIHRVARQRRLTVPTGLGPEGTDPNLVAAYLDNELDPEQVGEYEKRCLTSDVHLAEVASVHQILSLIGQKAKVPPEARYRMYRLIKGREAVNPRSARAFSPPHADPLTEPLVPWAPPEPPKRSQLERYGPVAFVCVLITGLVVTTWMSLNVSQRPASPPAVALVKPDAIKAAPPAEPNVAAPTKPAGGTDASEKAATPGSRETTTTAAAPKKGSDAAPEKKTEEPPPSDSSSSGSAIKGAPAVDLAPGSVGVADKSDSLILRFSSGARNPERLKPEASLKDDDRLVSLDHFRNNVQLGGTRAGLVGESEIVVHKPEQGLTAEFTWVRGRVVVYGVNPPAPVGVKVGDSLMKFTPPAGVPVGLEPAPDSPTGKGLRLYVSAGEVPLESGKATAKVVGPGSIVFQPPGGFLEPEKKDIPSWVTEVSPSAVDKQRGEEFARVFKPDQTVMHSLLEAAEDENKDVKESAIRTLGSIGQIDLVVPNLNKQGDQVARRAAMHTLRWLMAQGPEQTRVVKDQVIQFYGKSQGEIVNKLLEGYAPQETHEEATYSKLVVLLTSGETGVRELALDNLMALTGRDNLGYDPDSYEGAGLKQWQELQQRKELRPKAPLVPRSNPR